MKNKEDMKIFKEPYPYYFWNYEEQTKIKHFVIADYIDKWIQILGSKNKKLNIFDCYAGSGAYIENDIEYYGSPVFIAEAIEKYNTKLGINCKLFVIDIDNDNLENLRNIYTYKKLKVEPIYINNKFDDAINSILDNRKTLAPSFFFIDPFGFTLKYETIKKIMSFKQAEIVINFMFNSLNRFLGDAKLENIFNDLFGSDNWKNKLNCKKIEKENGIVELFNECLKKISNYVYPYRLSFQDKNRTYYYLYHITNHSKGCSIMKSCFTKYNYGEVEYKGPKHGELTLFNQDEYKIFETKEYLLNKYEGRYLSFNDIIQEIIDDITVTESVVKTTLKELEKEGKIKVDRKSSKTERGLYKDDVIHFSADKYLYEDDDIPF